MLISRWILFFCLVVIGIWQVEDSYSQNNTTGYVDGENRSHTEPTKDIAIPVRIVNTPYDQQAADAHAKAREEDNHREEANLAIQRSIAESSQIIAQYTPDQFYLGLGALTLSLITVIASGFAALFAYGAVSEARSSTSIAQRALDVTEDTARRQLRAYVTVSSCKSRYLSHHTGVEEFQFMIMLKNQGQTPAMNVRIWSSCQFSNDFNEAIKSKDKSIGGTRAPIGPTGEMKIEYGTSDRFIPNEEIQRARSGKVRCWVDGIVEYDDIFGNNHITNFRFYLSNANTEVPTLSISEKGNTIT
ncbi:hypothetical protein HBA91_00575 [Ochrobactrum sp. MR34]|nr:hypothetical protein [Ochrobactrum sp. MR34]